MLGLAQGAVIAIWRGQSGLPVRQANEAGIADSLVLTEGIEDALSVALSAPDCRVWAVGSLGNLAAIALPACAYEVIVFADNDWAKPEAEKQLAKAMQALGYQNRRVRLARSPEGKDANDLLRGQAA
jgi:DNA primase